MDRIKLAFKVLFIKEVVVITKNQMFSTMPDSTQYQSSKGGKVVWGNYNE